MVDKQDERKFADAIEKLTKMTIKFEELNSLADDWDYMAESIAENIPSEQPKLSKKQKKEAARAYLQKNHPKIYATFQEMHSFAESLDYELGEIADKFDELHDKLSDIQDAKDDVERLKQELDL